MTELGTEVEVSFSLEGRLTAHLCWSTYTQVSCLQQELKEHREQSKKYRWTLNERKVRNVDSFFWGTFHMVMLLIRCSLKRMIEELQANVSKLTRSQETSSPVETILERMRELEKEVQGSWRKGEANESGKAYPLLRFFPAASKQAADPRA